MAAGRTMNFFEQQDRARKKTGRLIFLFLVAVMLMATAVYAVVQVAIQWSVADDPKIHVPLFSPEIFAGVFGGVLLLVGIASLIRIVGLRGGGASIAVAMGARNIDPSTRDPHERRLMNVVEEMAIASGTSMPDVFVMDDEEGINAFAAGYTPGDAAVCVTRGALTRLNRDELQGVMAHEFSHIFNGDMRMNVRLMGVLFGILALTVVGRVMLRLGSGGRSSRSKGTPQLALIGLALVIIGYFGAFIGRIIKAAVSRQREFLADASAVQFTRNPDGIAGALKKIGGLDAGSRIQSPKAEEASHMFFGQGIKLSSILATHPPLVERIQRIDPNFAGEYAEPVEIAADSEAAVAGFAGAAGGVPVAPVHVNAAEVATRVGAVSDEALTLARAVHRSIPDEILRAARHPEAARGLLFAMLLSRNHAERTEQIEILRRVKPEWGGAAFSHYDAVSELDPRARLPLVEIVSATLRRLPKEEIPALLRAVEDLIAADGQVTLFEFGLQWLVTHRLLRDRGRPPRVAFTSLTPLAGDVAALLDKLARVGKPGDTAASRAAFEAGWNRLPDIGPAPAFADEDTIAWDRVSNALSRLSQASFAIRGAFIDAAAHTAFADELVTVNEADLLRILAVALDCPLPPFVES